MKNIMDRKSHERPARPKNNAGCISGLINMFAFRQVRSTQKLLSDRKHGNSSFGATVHTRNKLEVLSKLDERNEDVTDTDGKDIRRDNTSKCSTKGLMAEEISKAPISEKIPSSTIEELRLKFVFEDDHEKKQKRRQNQNYEVDHDVDDSRDSQSTWSDPSESSFFNVNLAELMVEFCREKYKKTLLTQKHEFLQNSIGSKQITEEFIDTLETLNSNKDNFLKLVQDPNSTPLKHTIDLQNAHDHVALHGVKPEELGNCQISHKQNKHNFFRKKEKSNGAKPLKRIVIWKPSPERYEHYSNTVSMIPSPGSLNNFPHQEDNLRVSSHFSLKEIKRRLRNMIGTNKKERKLIATDGILHKIPYGSQNSNDLTSKPSTFLNIGDKNAKKKVDKEAKKRLAMMLSANDKNEVSSPRQVTKSLGTILSLPAYNLSSPRFSPSRDKEANSLSQMRSSSLQKIEQGDSTYSESSSGSMESLPNGDNTSPILSEAQMHIEEDLTQKGSTKLEEHESLGIAVQFNIDEPVQSSEVLIEEYLGPFEEALPPDPSVLVSPNSVEKTEAPESTTENLARPSPVSVLEAFFDEDINIPQRTEIEYTELLVEPRRLSFEETEDSHLILTSTVTSEAKETKLKYVRSVLEASGLNNHKLPERWKSTDQLLDPFVFDEVEILYNQLIDDSKLLFDCVNEVLLQICDIYFSCTPWIYSIKPQILSVPTGENFVKEVCKRVDQCLQIVHPYTLEREVWRDFEGEAWMNVRLETECAVYEIEDVILDYIMEETVLELWD